MNSRQRYSVPLKLLGKLLKCFAMVCFGIAISLLLSATLGISGFTEGLLLLIQRHALKFIAIVGCIVALIFFAESWKQ